MVITMKILIGENIRRLRNEKKLTQEQLAETLGVTCAAVSKWERGDTYPDITLLFPLAHYFGVTLDELMGYGRDKIRAEIEEALARYRELNRIDYVKSRAFITEAYRKYPNDYRIMHAYMWNLGGDYADNDSEILLSHKDVFLSICDKLTEGCTDEHLRLDAWNMRAKLLHAEGKTEEAFEIYRTKFVDWYTTTAQKSEQLFAKDTPEFIYWVKKNMYELADFAADKLMKSIYFDSSLTACEKIKKAEYYSDLIAELREKTGDSFFLTMERTLYGRLQNDIKYRGGGTEEDLNRLMKKETEARDKLIRAAENDKALFDGAAYRFV